jgi:hypothetical protein
VSAASDSPGTYLGDLRGWEENGDAALSLLMARLAELDSAWDRQLSRIGVVLAAAIAILGAGLGVLVAQDSAPNGFQWAIASALVALSALMTVTCVVHFYSRRLEGVTSPKSVVEWVGWSDARAKWAGALAAAIEHNKAAAEAKAKWANALIAATVVQSTFAAALAVSALARL